MYYETVAGKAKNVDLVVNQEFGLFSRYIASQELIFRAFKTTSNFACYGRSFGARRALYRFNLLISNFSKSCSG